MYFTTYFYENIEDYGILNKEKTSIIPMEILLNELKRDVPKNLLSFIQIYSSDLISEINNIINEGKTKGIPLKNVKLMSPIPYPRRNIFCLGKNYIEHIQEMENFVKEQTDIPKYPIYFSKIADPSIGDGDKIVMPQNMSVKLDYEVELAIVIGKDGKDIPIDETEDYIFGYTVSNDITSRNHQKKHSQWFKGKSMDTFAPLGPFIAHKINIEYPPKLDMVCRVNNEIRQSFNTSKLIFDIPYIISDLSKGLTLRAGDIILTGTPAGVGLGFDPPRFLQKGDVIECYIEKIGSLTNYID